MDTRNYTSAAIGVIMLIATITWFTTGRKQFTGPPGATIEGTTQAESEEEKVPQGSMKGKNEL